MLYGTGTDIVSLTRIEKVVKKSGDSFLKKILTEKELKLLPSHEQISFIAGRFAAKEALYKAFGGNEPLAFTDVCIENDVRGKPVIHYVGTSQTVINTFAKVHIHLSISHEKEFAVAFVIIEEGPEFIEQ